MNKQSAITSFSALVFALSTGIAMAGNPVAGTPATDIEQTLVEADGARAVTVSLADLNLASAEGQEAMYYRLSGAAERVCGSQDYRTAGSPKLAAENRACYERALSDALAQASATALAHN